MDSAKKYEPKYRLARHGVIEKKKTESRRSRRKKRGSPTLPRPPHSRRFLEHRFIIESSAARIEMTKNCELLNMIPSQLAGIHLFISARFSVLRVSCREFEFTSS